MTPDERTRATELLSKSLDGDHQSALEFFPLVYEELRALAARQLGRESPGHTLQATALVNEAYLRLIDTDLIELNGKTHFFAVAATTMRRILVDHARAKRTRKRGGATTPISLSDVPLSQKECDVLDVLALDEALSKLAESKPRHARLVELRFFAGFSIEESAEVLEVSKETANVDWRFARAWLNRELSAD